MKQGKRLFPGLLGLILILGGAGLLRSQQQPPPYTLAEYNDYIAATRLQDPQEQTQAIEQFLKTYPKSVLRAFLYPTYLKAAWTLKRYSAVMNAVADFLAMDREAVEKLYRQSNYNDLQIQYTYYQPLLFYAYSFLQPTRESEANTDGAASRAIEYAQRGLQAHADFYGKFPAPADASQRQQLEQTKQQEATVFHQVLATASLRKKDYNPASKEYGWLVEHSPNDAPLNYQYARVLLQQVPPDYPRGFWYLGRAVGLNIAKSEEVKDYLTKSVAAYQQVPPECQNDQVADLIAAAAGSVQPPAGWELPSAADVQTVRDQMTVKRIFDDLKLGGDTAHMMYLASCGTVIGLGEDGQPELAVLVLNVAQTPGNSVTLRAAAGQEAVNAKLANVEVRVETPPEAKSLKVEDVVRVSGKIVGFQSDPQFLLKLSEGKVNPEDIPKSRR